MLLVIKKRKGNKIIELTCGPWIICGGVNNYTYNQVSRKTSYRSHYDLRVAFPSTVPIYCMCVCAMALMNTHDWPSVLTTVCTLYCTYIYYVHT